jgi:hypothetical protein
VEKSSDDNDDGSYIPSERERLKRDEDERQDINITAEKSDNSEGETEIAKKIKKGHVYQDIDEIKA